MTLALWLSLVAACLMISLTPGAGAVNTMTTSLLHGWKKAFFTVMGQQLALVVQIAIVAAGLGVVVANSPVLFDVIRYGGAAYLVYLGLRMILARPQTPQLPQYLVLAGTMVAIDIVVMWGGFVLVAKTLTRLSHSERGQTILNRVFGSLFILVAALMVFAGH